MKTDEEYLDKEFPKGKTKFRGQAMVLLALAKQEGKQAEQKRILELIDKWWKDDNTCSGRPHCCIKECDLCVNCFDELKKEVEKKLAGEKLTK